MKKTLLPLLFALMTVATSCTTTSTEPAADATGSMTSSAAPATATDPAMLAGKWRIQTLNGAALPAEAAAEAMLEFDATAGKVAGSTGCNRLMGTYTTSNTGVTFGSFASTRMACAPNNPEAILLTVLDSKTLTYQLTGNNLTFLDGTTPVVTLSR